MTAELKIVSHVPVPQTQAELKNQRLFASYRRAYASVHVKMPVFKGMTANGYFLADTLETAVSPARLKELTNMLRARAKEQR